MDYIQNFEVTLTYHDIDFVEYSELTGANSDAFHESARRIIQDIIKTHSAGNVDVDVSVI